MSLTITLPIYWQQNKRKVVLVSMNAYRNWHYYTSNTFKQEFTELVLNQLPEEVPRFRIYELEISLYYKNPACDPSNIVALIEKVTLDAFQKAKVVIDDTVQFHIKTTWTVKEQDKENPRTVVTIREYDGK